MAKEKNKPTGLTKSECVRFGKEVIKKEISKSLKEMPEGFYYQFCLEVLSGEEYLRRERLKGELLK